MGPRRRAYHASDRNPTGRQSSAPSRLLEPRAARGSTFAHKGGVPGRHTCVSRRLARPVTHVNHQAAGPCVVHHIFHTTGQKLGLSPGTSRPRPRLISSLSWTRPSRLACFREIDRVIADLAPVGLRPGRPRLHPGSTTTPSGVTSDSIPSRERLHPRPASSRPCASLRRRQRVTYGTWMQCAIRASDGRDAQRVPLGWMRRVSAPATARPCPTAAAGGTTRCPGSPP
jgi:hypothetical protein